MTTTTQSTTPDIQLLPPHLINKIAAGEVVERPASVVKELVENALDAGATKIEISAKQGGKWLRIADNGHGMTPDNAQRAFINHATSKIKSDADLAAISTMGFRGEALASIASVSKFTCLTRPHNAELGTKIIVQPNGESLITPTGCGAGTVMEIDDLFYTTPARLKFLKQDSTELAHIDDTVKRLALANPHVQFTLSVNDKTTLATTGDNNPQRTLNQVLKLNPTDNRDFVSIQLEDPEHGTKITGVASTPNIAKNSRQQCYIFVNRRPIKCPIIHKAIDAAYQGMLHPGKYPIAALFITLPPADVDVNVHPTKREVRYAKPNTIFSLVKYGILNALTERGLSPTLPNQRHSTFSEVLPISSPTGNPWPSHGEYSTRGSSNPSSWARPDYQPSQPGASQLAQQVFAPLSFQENFSPEQPNNQLSQCSAPKGPKTPKVIGQLFNTYILLETAQGLMVVDQHIASERTLFEQLKRAEEAENNPSQALITPLIIDVTADEAELLEQHRPLFEQLGFAFTLTDSPTIELTALPAVYLDKHDATDWLRDGLQQLAHSESAELNLDDLLATMSCHRAIRAGDPLTHNEMTTIIERWLACTLPWTCPHGRPIAHTIETGELNKLFDRPSLPANAF